MPVVTPPFSFSVPAKVRQGQFSTSVFTLSAPASTIYFELDIPNTSQYENTANTVTVQLLVNGSDPAIVWQGGRFVNKLGVVDPPPPFEWDISQYPAGTSFQLTATVLNSMDIGIQNGLIS